jgi:hypothetical protein
METGVASFLGKLVASDVVTLIAGSLEPADEPEAQVREASMLATRRRVVS